MSDGAARIVDGKLFDACAAATGNVRSPEIDRRTGGTVNVLVAATIEDGGVPLCQLPDSRRQQR